VVTLVFDGTRFSEKTQSVPVSLRFATHLWVVDCRRHPCHRLLGFPTFGASSLTAASLRDSVQQEKSALYRECPISRAPNHRIRSLDASSLRVFRKPQHKNAPPRASIVLRSQDRARRKIHLNPRVFWAVSTTLPVAPDREPSATPQITRFGAKKIAKRLRSVGFPAWTPVLTAAITLTTSHRPISFHFSHFSLSFPFLRQNPAENVRGSLLAAHSRSRLVLAHALDGACFPRKLSLFRSLCVSRPTFRCSIIIAARATDC
jgi:hypothetical protein